MTTVATDVRSLYRARKGSVDFVDVPDLGCVIVDGVGAPGGGAFADAIKAIYTVSYGAHFIVKKLSGEAPRVMPLEALWWTVGDEQQRMVARVAAGAATMSDTDRARWRWSAFIVQQEPIDAEVVGRAIAGALAKGLAAPADLRYERWTEGHSAQTLHVGPYAEEAPTIAALHEAIAAAGLRPHGRHHEIYLGDPRRAAPERLRTILRQPVERVR